jgi:serine/threonine protein kinase
MTSTVYGRIGPYAIERPIGQGGMASVFLARDTRTDALVALKLVHTGADDDAREILEAERRGAELQQRFSATSVYVPHVYESGFVTDYFYIAMEYVVGEDLSHAIHRGPMPWPRAAAIAMQICEFLEHADRFETQEGSRRVLLHNDLKPRNIRLMADDRIKVLDFGAAKALSLSRKVTRNDFGSTAYLSPECLESGDRDRYSDSWALGVLLYEMVCGRQPFRGDDTRLLERRIRSRRPPEPMDGCCPPAMQAIIARLLAPYPADRYASAADIRADLARVQAGDTPQALALGWPARLHDEPPTRRTQDPVGVEPETRRTNGDDASHTGAAAPSGASKTDAPDVPTAAPQTGVADAIGAPQTGAPYVPARRTLWRRIPKLIRRAAIVIVVALVLNESCVASSANDLADTVPLQDFAGLSEIWPRYQSLAGSSTFGWGVGRLESVLTQHTRVLADRVIANYRTPMPTVRENQWKAARDALRRAIAIAPHDTSLRASLRYCEGHLHRINGEAAKERDQETQAQQEFAEALVAFREAAELRPRWPDPFLGLARTFIYGLEDVDRGADALEQAEKHGHQPSERETTQLADGYRARGETLARTAQTLRGLPQERDYLNRAAEAFREALQRYTTVSGFGNAALSIRYTQTRIDRIQQRLDELGRGSWPWD